MEISQLRLQEFQDAYKSDFGDDISPEEAREILSRLVTLYELLRTPITDKPIEERVSDCWALPSTQLLLR